MSGYVLWLDLNCPWPASSILIPRIHFIFLPHHGWPRNWTTHSWLGRKRCSELAVRSWLSAVWKPNKRSAIIFESNWFAILNTTLEHKIQGDSLCELDSEGLKSLGVTTIGQRLSILKSIYLVKLAHEVPIDENHYVPPCKSFNLRFPLFYWLNDVDSRSFWTRWKYFSWKTACDS